MPLSCPHPFPSSHFLSGISHITYYMLQSSVQPPSHVANTTMDNCSPQRQPFHQQERTNTAGTFTETHQHDYMFIISAHTYTHRCVIASSLCSTLCIMKCCLFPISTMSIIKGFISFHRFWKILSATKAYINCQTTRQEETGRDEDPAHRGLRQLGTRAYFFPFITHSWAVLGFN